jgi:hypothetical protein
MVEVNNLNKTDSNSDLKNGASGEDVDLNRRGNNFMKRFLFAVFILTLGVFTGFARNDGNKNSTRDEAVVQFTENVKLWNVFLKGEYLIVHDESKMADGLPCLYIYQMKDGKADKLVTSIHCVRVEREKANGLVLSISRLRSPFDVREITEIQFAGRTESHKIPTN